MEKVRFASFRLKGLFVLSVIVLCFWYSRDHLAALDSGAIVAAVAGLGPLQWLGGLGAVAISFVAVAGQERVANRLLNLPERRVLRAGVAAASVVQAVGMGPVVGTMIRLRLRPELSLLQAVTLSSALSFGFMAGLGLILLVTLMIFPQGGAVSASVAGGAALALCLGMGGAVWLLLRGSSPKVARLIDGLKFFGLICLDVAALFMALTILLPAQVVVGLPAFLMAFAAGLLSGSPAGTGPFEAVLLSQVDGQQASALMAGILSFRLVAYALPALCGAAYGIVAGRALGQNRFAIPPDLNNCPRAEVMLTRQGHLALQPLAAAHYWMQGKAGIARVWLGDPVGLHHLPRDPAALIPRGAGMNVLYKIGQRTAARARAAGHSVLHIADEALLDPRQFSTDGPALANLRRKLRHAAKAGVGVGEARVPPLSSLPLAQMEEVNADWCARHGVERGFSMGVWDRDYIAAQRVFLAWDAAGQLVAFATFHATAQEWVLDLIRFRTTAPDGTLYALIVAALGAAGRAGVPRLSLAAAPVTDGKGWLGRIVARLSRKGRGLRQFKATFAPKWEPRYIATRQAWALPLALILLARRINTRRKTQVVAVAVEEAEPLATAA